MSDEHYFTCPECGGHYFGRETKDGWPTDTVCCHGSGSDEPCRLCDWRGDWPQKGKSEMNSKYYEAKPSHGAYKAHIYRYKPDGNATETVYLSERTYETTGEAEDAALEWASLNGQEDDLELG